MAELKPTISAVRAPNTMREKMSRPSWSVPSRCVQPGASVIAAKSFEVGLYGAIHSAPSPAAAMIRTITIPNVPTGSRRQNASTVPNGERLICVTSLSVTICGANWNGALTDMALSPSGETDARIEPRIEQIDDKIGQYEDHHDEHHQSLGQGVVMVLHRQ